MHVITVKGKKEFGDFGFKYNKNVKFYHCEDKNYNPGEMVKTIFGQNKIDKILFSIKTYGIKHLFSIINRRLKSLYMIDRYEISCVKNLFKLTTQVIEEHSISRILVMTPPFSMYKLALKIKKKFNQIPLIIDIQDSWVIPALKI